jgi:pantetheine-phosphate adenylyltransferase
MNGRVAIYPGSFDPTTFGHLDLIQRAAKIFDKVIVAVAKDTPKNTFFTVAERVAMLQDATKGLSNVRIESFSGLVVDFARRHKAHVLVRGLRMITDFEFELQMALTNRRLADEIETIFLMPSEGHQFLSSSLVKEAGSLGADISSFTPAAVTAAFKKKLIKGGKRR